MRRDHDRRACAGRRRRRPDGRSMPERDGKINRHRAIVKSGENISPPDARHRPARGSSRRGHKIDYAHIGVMASVGACRMTVYAKPRVSIITTGDELVEVDEQPETYQIRNSNSYSLAAQVQRAGGAMHIRTVARDTEDEPAQRRWTAP